VLKIKIVAESCSDLFKRANINWSLLVLLSCKSDFWLGLNEKKAASLAEIKAERISSTIITLIATIMLKDKLFVIIRNTVSVLSGSVSKAI